MTAQKCAFSAGVVGPRRSMGLFKLNTARQDSCEEVIRESEQSLNYSE